ncbi:hypothetical protein N7493_003789 [Penicillium malachiteum]|uniref:Cell wall mannoprotein PIR1-like C-terminal domain-containing protein n=1 Tax=Penicillium malachiteum TaxID=1324776 RepID=A0AAD6HRB1_9EURO|nr:hypothetical protein N7493_003789 [Penicillium malachiteum]
MKSFIAIAAFAAGANALVSRSNSCCFEITASGGASGTLGQLSDGQVRVGDTTLSAAEFCLSGSIITDSEGRGCVITTETTQFQCDQGASGTSGFSLTSSGLLEFDGSSSFIACQTGEDNGSNIYTTNSTSVTNCVNVELTSDSTCAVSSSSVVPAATPVPTSSSPAPVAVSPVASSAPAPAAESTTSRPLIPTSPAQSVAPVPVSSTPVAKVTTASSTSTTSTASTVGSSTSAAASGAASTAPATSSATAPALGFAHWVAALTVMVSMMVVS